MDRKSEAEKLGNRADQHFLTGDYSKAALSYERAVMISRELKDRENESHWLGNLGLSYLMLGDHPRSIACLQQALELARKSSDADLNEFLLDKLAVAYWGVGLHAKAVDCLVAGIDSARRSGNRKNEMSLSGHLGNVFSSNGAFHKATPWYLRALEIARDLGDQQAVGLWLGNLGNNYLGLELCGDAIAHYEKAIEIARSVGDEDNKNRWMLGLREAQQRLRKRKSVKRGIVEPSIIPGAFVFQGLAARVSLVPDIDEKRQLILSERDAVNAAIEAAIEEAEPCEALALIDCVKSLISRELLIRKRMDMAGITKGDVVVHGLNPSQVLQPVVREPDLATISFYYTEEKKFYAFLSFLQDGRPLVEKIVVASGRAGENLHEALLMLAERRKNTPFDDIDYVLVNLLNDIGQAILPSLSRLKGIKRVLLVPFKLLYLLPLHVMLSNLDKGLQILDGIGPTTYSSSLCNYELRGKYGGMRHTAKRVLAFIDIPYLGEKANLEKECYDDLRAAFVEATGKGDAVNVVTDVAALPVDLGAYQVIAWSSHAFSNPTNWTESHLRAGPIRITAREILETWSLHNTEVAILSACETGIDKTIDDKLDEYFGIDMAVHVSGAETVVSTMWPVEESLASLVSLFLAEGIARHQESPTKFLRLVRSDLSSGNWKDRVTANYARLTPTQKKRFGARFERILANDKDAFRSIGAWSSYRTFGGW